MSVMQSNPSRETGNPLVDGITKVFLRLGRLVERLLPSEPPKRPPDMTDAELAGLAAGGPVERRARVAGRPARRPGERDPWSSWRPTAGAPRESSAPGSVKRSGQRATRPAIAGSCRKT